MVRTTIEEKIVTKYLEGKTSRDEERYLLDKCLIAINDLMTKLRVYKR